MRRHVRVLLATSLMRVDPNKLFGSGRERNALQKKVFKQLKNSTIQKSFPHIAACWVGPCWGTVMLTPNNVSPVCNKIAVWRCSGCMKEFEMSIAKFIDSKGVCPLCHRPQKKLEANTEVNKDGVTVAKKAQYVKAPRMIHSNYRSVLFTNPEWEQKNIQPMLAQRWELIADELLASKKSTKGGTYSSQGGATANAKNSSGANSNSSNKDGLGTKGEIRGNAGGAAYDHDGAHKNNNDNVDYDDDDDRELLLASPKIDGIRCIVGYNTTRDEVQFFSRGGIILECCHGLVDELKPLFKTDPELMIDGELFAPECNFEQLNGLVRKLEKKSSPMIRQSQSRLLEYFAFDIMYSSQLSSVDAPFEERYRLLKKLIPVCGAKRISNYQHDEKKKKIIRAQHRSAAGATATHDEKANKVYHVPAAQVRPEEMDDVLSEACSQGFEGVMIRRPSFPYEHGRRSFGLLKYKQMHDAEFKVVGFLAGDGKFLGGLGAFICETRDGLRFSATPKVSYKRRVELWGERKKFLGKYLTVQYQELSSQDVPRFPIAKMLRGGENRQEWL